MTKIIWHKTNKISMIKEAILTNGISGIEFDVIITKDNIPVLFHDRTMSTKVISELTLIELKKLKPNIPTLKEAFLEINKLDYSDDFIFHLEIKQSETFAWDRTVDVLRQFPIINRQTVPRSFQENIISYIKSKSNRKVCLLLCGLSKETETETDFKLSGKTIVIKLPNVRELTDICSGIIPEYVSIDYKIITKEFIDNMKSANVIVDVYTLNDINGIGYKKVDAIVSDVPEKFINKNITYFDLHKTYTNIFFDMAEQVVENYKKVWA